MMDVVTGTGRLVASMYESLGAQAESLGASLEIVNSKLDDLAARGADVLRFETIRHARALQDAVLAGGLSLPSSSSSSSTDHHPLRPVPYYSADDDLAATLALDFQLSQRDHWATNGVLAALLAWSRAGRDRLLWVGGRSGGRESWVSDFAGDLVQALLPQPGTTVL